MVSLAHTPSSKRFQLYRTHFTIKSLLDRHFINETPICTVGRKRLGITDIVAAAIQSKTNIYLIGSRGTGKTLLAESVQRMIFGDRGLYLRGDLELRVKDLYLRLNLDGRTDSELVTLAPTIALNFVLIDELPRVPGVLQNQFLNLLDGYIEIRGKKYWLGRNSYLLAIATGNPVKDGEYTGSFSEDLALLDRIPLIINTDEVPLSAGDAFLIRRASLDKQSIGSSDLTDDVLMANQILAELRASDPLLRTASSLLAEYTYSTFRYAQLASGILVDKTQVQNWRDSLTGEHAGGEVYNYCSDVSTRTILAAGNLGLALYLISTTESEILGGIGELVEPVTLQDYLDSFFAALKLSLTYDRRFITPGLPESMGKTHAQLLDAAIGDVRSRIDLNSFTGAVSLLSEFEDYASSNNEAGMKDILNELKRIAKESGTAIVETAVSIAEGWSNLHSKRVLESKIATLFKDGE